VHCAAALVYLLLVSFPLSRPLVISSVAVSFRDHLSGGIILWSYQYPLVPSLCCLCLPLQPVLKSPVSSFPGAWSFSVSICGAGSAVICQLLHLPLPKTKKNLAPLQAVKRKMKIIRTKGLEVCI
jgi:hypothetical protein